MKTQPEAPTTRIVSFVEHSMAVRIADLARANDRSVSAEIRRLLRQATQDPR